MSKTPQRENLVPLWKAALDRLGTETVKTRLAHTGSDLGAEFRNLVPGYNRNPSRRFVEAWLAKRRRRDSRMDWALRIGALAIAALGMAIAL